MKINAVKTYLCPSFKANKTSLYADFDGTFIPRSIAPIKDNSSGKEALVQGYNKYFKLFQQFIDDKKDLFDIRISTGRKYSGESGDGFLGTYNLMRNAGVKFPQIKELVTAEGGDIYAFNPDGTLSAKPSGEKLDFIVQKTGWNRKEIDSAVKKIAEELGIEARAVDLRSSHKLSLVLSDELQSVNFIDKLKAWLKEHSVNAKAKVSEHVYEYLPDGSHKKTLGIKAEPLFEGHTIHKDFDIKAAIARAIKAKDFVIAAGDADNDKEMLNMFNYAGLRQIDSKSAIQSLDAETIRQAQGKIAKLPIGIVYVDHLEDEVGNPKRHKYAALSEFMHEQKKIFPDRIRIVQKSDLGKNNTLLEAAKELIAGYFDEADTVAADIKKSGKSLKKISAAGAVLIALGGIAGAYKHYSSSAKDKNFTGL